jgi:hypothetical protein
MQCAKSVGDDSRRAEIEMTASHSPRKQSVVVGNCAGISDSKTGIAAFGRYPYFYLSFTQNTVPCSLKITY